MKVKIDNIVSFCKINTRKGEEKKIIGHNNNLIITTLKHTEVNIKGKEKERRTNRKQESKIKTKQHSNPVNNVLKR